MIISKHYSRFLLRSALALFVVPFGRPSRGVLAAAETRSSSFEPAVLSLSLDGVIAAAASVSAAAAKPRSPLSAAAADVTFRPAELSLLVDSDDDEDVGDVSADAELGDNAATTNQEEMSSHI